MNKHKFYGLLTIIFVVFAFITPTALLFKSVHADTPNVNIITPTNIAILNGKIAVLDGDQIKIFDSTPANADAGASILAQKSFADLISVKSDGTELFILTGSETTNKTIVKLTDTLTETALEFPSAYPTNAIQDFFVKDNNLFVLRNDNLSIDIFNLNTTNPLTVENTIDRNYIEYYKDETSANYITFNNGFVFIASPNKVYKIDVTTKASTVPYILADTITGLTPNYVLTKTTATNLNDATTISLSNDSYSVAEDGDYLYATYPNIHKIKRINVTTNLTEDLNINKKTVVTAYTTPNFKHLKSNTALNLLYEPYSPNPTQILPENNYLTAVGETETHYYCLVPTATQNVFFYVSKTDNFEILDVGNTESTYTATRNAPVYTYPSLTTDNTNRNIFTIQPTGNVTVLNTTIIYNTMGDSFYLVKINDTYGFVKAKLLQSNRLAVELTKETNAKTKRETVLYEEETGETEIIKLSKKSRITLTEEYSSKKEFLACEYQDEKGIVYTGYIASADVSPDGLSTLQILGLILVGTNILLLLLILIIKLNSKKWKV